MSRSYFQWMIKNTVIYKKVVSKKMVYGSETHLREVPFYVKSRIETS